MRILDRLVDSEGYVHMDLMLEAGDSRKQLIEELYLDHIEDCDRRVEEQTGFEFFHIKAL